MADLKVDFLSYLQAGDVPVEFEEFHLSEVQNMASEEKLEQVLTSMKNNKVAMKGSCTQSLVSSHSSPPFNNNKRVT